MNWIHWSLLSAFFAAVTAILAKVGIRDVDSNLATFVRTAVVLIFAGVLVALSGSFSNLRDFAPKTWLFLGLSGLATGISWLCYFKALQIGEASKVAPVDKLSVVFVIILAALFLGEAPTWKSGLGGGLIAAGAILLALK